MTTSTAKKPRGPAVKIKKRPRAPASVLVSLSTEWTDYHGVQMLFGLRRSLAYHLWKSDLIKSRSLKHGSEKRGKRLFNVASIRQYLNEGGAG
jgi:hypothetical protein